MFRSMHAEFLSLIPEESESRMYVLRNKWAILQYLSLDPNWSTNCIELQNTPGWNADSYITVYDTFDT